MFIRFASLQVDCDSGRERGVFQTAYWLKDSGLLNEDEVQQIDVLLAIYEEHLDVPDCYRNPVLSRKRRYAAICWFKSQSRKFIGSMWAVVAFLKSHGVPMKLFRTHLPGRVLYEDEHQVAAIPFRRAREFQNWI